MIAVVMGMGVPNNPIFFIRGHIKVNNGLFSYRGFHAVAIGRGNSAISITNSGHVAPFNTALHRCGLSRLPNL